MHTRHEALFVFPCFCAAIFLTGCDRLNEVKTESQQATNELTSLRKEWAEVNARIADLQKLLRQNPSEIVDPEMTPAEFEKSRQILQARLDELAKAKKVANDKLVAMKRLLSEHYEMRAKIP